MCRTFLPFNWQWQFVKCPLRLCKSIRSNDRAELNVVNTSLKLIRVCKRKPLITASKSQSTVHYSYYIEQPSAQFPSSIVLITLSLLVMVNSLMTEEYLFVLSCDAGDTRSFEVAPQTYLIIYSFCKLI